jgi:hypothetical protein
VLVSNRSTKVPFLGFEGFTPDGVRFRLPNTISGFRALYTLNATLAQRNTIGFAAWLCSNDREKEAKALLEADKFEVHELHPRTQIF